MHNPHKIEKNELELETGSLFSSLWHEYDDAEFKHSVELFERRLKLIGEPLNSIKDGKVLDAGCGGGRNSIALKLAGAKNVVGVDIGIDGLKDASKRVQKLDLSRDIEFLPASIQNLPFQDNEFDVVWCAGVLMIVENESVALDELLRVLKPGGVLYLLVYASGGMRWPLISLLRPICANIGIEEIETAIKLSNQNAASRRTFLDDLFCPKLDFYSWERLERMLTNRNVKSITRLGSEVRLDHEASIEDYLFDLERLFLIFDSGSKAQLHPLFEECSEIVKHTINAIEKLNSVNLNANQLGQVIGMGHHRVIIQK